MNFFIYILIEYNIEHTKVSFADYRLVDIANVFIRERKVIYGTA